MKKITIYDKDQYCPIHNTRMLALYGCGWDYDRFLCPIRGCEYEIELETTTLPEEKEEI